MARSLSTDASWIKVAEQSSAGMWQDYEFGVPGKYSVYNNDFHQYVSADWTVTETDAAATQALASVAPCVGGVLLITDTNADNDAVSMQLLGHAFVPTAGTKLYFEARFQASEATSIDILFGLVATDTTPLANANGIYFIKPDDGASLDFVTNSSSVSSTETSTATFVANTYFKVGFKVTGTSLVEYYVNDVKQGEFNTNIPTAPLRVTMHVQDGDTAAALGALTASVDYVIVAQERPGY